MRSRECSSQLPHSRNEWRKNAVGAEGELCPVFRRLSYGVGGRHSSHRRSQPGAYRYARPRNTAMRQVRSPLKGLSPKTKSGCERGCYAINPPRSPPARARPKATVLKAASVVYESSSRISKSPVIYMTNEWRIFAGLGPCCRFGRESGRFPGFPVGLVGDEAAVAPRVTSPGKCSTLL